MNSSRERFRTLVCRWGGFTLLFLLMTILETTPGLLRIGSIKPLFILPAALAVAVQEDELNAAFFGAACGLVWDWTAARYAGGFAIEFALVCLLTSMLTRVYLRLNTFSFCLISAGGCWLICSLDFLFSYQMAGFGHGAERYFFYIIPMVIYSAVLSPLSYVCARGIANRFVLE